MSSLFRRGRQKPHLRTPTWLFARTQNIRKRQLGFTKGCFICDGVALFFLKLLLYNDGEITKMKYDFLIIGAGLYGSAIARCLKDYGKSVLVVEKRKTVAGNIYTERVCGINVHKYGAHIFHTNDEEVWSFVNRFATFNRFTNSPIAVYKDEVYSLPFNMYTFNRIWGVITPKEAYERIEAEKKKAGIKNPTNLEEQAISLVGEEIYEKLIKGYTHKQWGRPCKELPAFIIKRLPVRFSYDNNYFNAVFQGIPMGGYTDMINRMLSGVEVITDCDFLENRNELSKKASHIIYTGPIDKYYDYCFGELEYRSIRFETQILDTDNYQGNAVVNYTDEDVPYTRIIEHKWFEDTYEHISNPHKTIISKEYSVETKVGEEPYYPVNDEKNSLLYDKYKKLADSEDNVSFGGRLGEYKYYDMDVTVSKAIKASYEWR